MRKNSFLKMALVILLYAAVLIMLIVISINSAKTGNSGESTGESAEQSESVDVEQSESVSAEQSEPVEGEGYYWDNSQKVIAVIEVKKSKEIPSESEVIKILKERGFENCTVTYEYDLDGNYQEETEISDNSSEKHPMYLAYYTSSVGDVWTIHIINGKVFAYPASFNLNSDLQAEVIVSETNEITSYENETNTFIVTIPKETAAIVLTVDRIDSETLETLTAEEISNYGK